MKGFTLVRLVCGLACLVTLLAVSLVLFRPAMAQSGRARTVHMATGPIMAHDKSQIHCAVTLPAVQHLNGGGGGGGGGSFRCSGFFDVFLEYSDAGGSNKRIKVQFHWDRTMERGDILTVTGTPSQDRITWTVDTQAPTVTMLNGLPPGTPYIMRVCPVVRCSNIKATEPDPTASMTVDNIGSSGQDGVSVNFFDIWTE